MKTDLIIALAFTAFILANLAFVRFLIWRAKRNGERIAKKIIDNHMGL